MMVALAIPPPSHIVCRPYRPPRCSRALTSVVMMRAPLAPSGWPMAMATVDVCPSKHVIALHLIHITGPGAGDRGHAVARTRDHLACRELANSAFCPSPGLS